MNIALISFWSCPLTRVGVLNAGGMSIYVLNLSRYLADLGFKIDIFTRMHRREKHTVLQIHKNVRVIHVKYNNLGYTSANQKKAISVFSQNIINYISKNNINYNILYCHYYLSGLAGLDLKPVLRIPFFQTFHTLSKAKELYAGMIDRERGKSEKEIIEKADAIIASTVLEKGDLMNQYHAGGKKIFVVEPGVNHHLFKKHDRKESRFKLNLPQNKKIILFVGRIDPIKGITLLIDSVNILTKKYSSVICNFEVLLIGGDIENRKFWKNEEVKKIQKLIIAKNLDCCIKFIGSRPHHMLPFYYSSADMVVMPSSYESFSLVVLEAMACGSVVLASRVGGLKYLIRDGFNGRLFRSGDSLNLAQIIWEVLNDKIERQKFSQNAITSSQNFCWEKQAEKMRHIFMNFVK